MRKRKKPIQVYCIRKNVPLTQDTFEWAHELGIDVQKDMLEDEVMSMIYDRTKGRPQGGGSSYIKPPFDEENHNPFKYWDEDY